MSTFCIIWTAKVFFSRQVVDYFPKKVWWVGEDFWIHFHFLYLIKSTSRDWGTGVEGVNSLGVEILNSKGITQFYTMANGVHSPAGVTF